MHIIPHRFGQLNKAVNIGFKGWNADCLAKTVSYEYDTFEKSKTQPSAPAVRVLKRGEIYCNKSCPKSWLFRNDIKWENLAAYLQKRFDSPDKVNTYIYGCPEGKEPYTMSIVLQESFKDEAEKFFPIMAKDIDEKIIADNLKAQIKPIPIKEGFQRTAKNLKTPEKYITPADNGQDGYISKKVRDKVQFSCTNILEDIENIDNSAPSIIMCRNMWPYIDSGEYDDFANRLYERLAPGSIVIIGEYDCSGEDGLPGTDKFPNALLDAGFQIATHYLDSSSPNLNHYFIFEKNRPFIF